MTQGALPFKYEEEKKDVGLTSFAGLPVFLDLFKKMNLFSIVDRHLQAKADKQGWADSQLVLSLLLLNLCGCDCVDDIRYLESDSGLRRFLKNLELRNAWGRIREKVKRRWRKPNHRSLPSASSLFRYLEMFHNIDEEKRRKKVRAEREKEIKAGKERYHKAFIPNSNNNLCGLNCINQEFINLLQLNQPQSTATLDMDATVVESSKFQALSSYKGFKGYQPLNTWWSEQRVVLHTEFRDGNVPAGHQQARVFSDALDCLPSGVEKVYLRSDTAGYQWDLMKYCELGKNNRFGRIEFAIGCDISKEFKKEVNLLSTDAWHPIHKKVKGKLVETGQWAEVPFVPKAIGFSKKGPDYRFIAIREPLKQRVLPGLESQTNLPFQTIFLNDNNYKLFGMVTNMDWEGESLIHWHRKRCGDSEHVHCEMKTSFCGGRFPSGKFGANAAWWWFMVLTINIASITKSLVLPKEWRQKRMKGLALFVIRVAGRVISKGGEMIIRISRRHPVFQTLLDARSKIMTLCSLPSG